jgi:NTE family protein
MSSVGLVLGGGGITGASYHFGVLLAIKMATGWDPNSADVIVGTSCGSFVGALVRGNALDLDILVGESANRDEVAERLRSHVFRRRRTPRGGMRWLRKSLLPGILKPDLNLIVGSPGLYDTSGIAAWVEESIGDLANTWPARPTVIVGYDVAEKLRVPFGTEGAPPVSLKQAVAASTAVPFVYEPVEIGGRWYADGGIASGTSADLLLANPTPLDLVIVIAPMAATETRSNSRFYEGLFDRAGNSALDAEIETVRSEWPDADVIILRPDERVLEATRPNPFSVDAAIPAFLRTLRSLRDELGHHEMWTILERHLVDGVPA